MDKDSVDLKGARVLLVDDMPANLEVLRELLEGEGYEISLAPGGEIALRIVREAEERPDLILLDVMMPGMDGYEVCRRLKADPGTRDIPVIFITAQDLTEGVLEGFRAGGLDYIAKPFRDQEVLVRVQTHLRLSFMARELAARNQELEREIAQRRKLKGQLSMISRREAERWGLEDFVGQSPTMRKIFADIRLLQESAGISVLIAGESGTGKELIARAIHFGSARAEGPFVPVNCAAIPRELVESALFGHVKGAFTGADADREGYFELAHEGTLFLDEIGDMPLELQGKLLRVLEDGQVWPVGGKEGRVVAARVLAATNADLAERIRDGSFRQDLYFRLARFTVTAPPLRERQEDIPLLARHFLRLFAGEMGREAPEIAPEGLARLSSYVFPGNVRELKNIIERALMESGGGEIVPEHLHFQPETGAVSSRATVDAPARTTVDAAQEEVPLNLEKAEMWLIKRAIGRAGGNISEAARLLGTNRTRIYRALSQEEKG